MDLVAGVKRSSSSWSMLPRTGRSSCTLQSTADRRKVVDLVITDLGVFAIDKHGFAAWR